MKSNYKKVDFPVSHIRKHLEPGPVVLVSSKYETEDNIMTMGWHMVMEFNPSLISCIISSGNKSHHLIKKSGECVINIPTADMVQQVIGIGTTSGNENDKFDTFNLTRENSQIVSAPCIKECYASLECVIVDRSMIEKYNMFVFQVVKAHVSSSPKFPKTLHYKGSGNFMIAGKNLSLPDQFPSEYA